MTIVIDVDDHVLEQITKQLNKLINVLKIVEYCDDAVVARELVLIKVRADENSRAAVLQVVELFRAKVVDVANDAVTIEATGSREKLAALREVLQPHGIKEIVQSGGVALARGSRSMNDRTVRSAERSA